jgi:HAD superfamily hydrolase (TIGR01509 family)
VTGAGHRTPLRAVLFDLDGTLVDSLPTIGAAMSEAMRMHGFDVSPEDVMPRIGPPMDVLVEMVTGCPREVALRVDADFKRLYYGTYIQHTPSIAGASELLDDLEAAGVALSVITNKVESGGRQMLEIMGWAHRFATVVGRDTTQPKPAPDGALLALERMGAPAAEAAIVGDTEYDVVCGRDAGIASVVGLVGSRSAEDLRAAGATHVVERLDEVAPILLGARAAR